MITAFGLPALLFTITLVDDVNYRIRIYADETMEGIQSAINAENRQGLRDFVIDCRKISREYPGLAALDFENVLKVTVEHLLGWSIREGKNKPDEGLFGVRVMSGLFLCEPLLHAKHDGKSIVPCRE